MALKEVVITSLPMKYYSYYQWLILGFYEMESKGEISFKIPFYMRYKLFFNRYTIALIQKIFKTDESYTMTGFIKNGDIKKTFCYDISDTPFVFEENILKNIDFYFKAQCPIDIASGSFKITDDVLIDYSPCVMEYKEKIKPSMIGVRRLADSLSYKDLLSNYKKMKSSREVKKDKFIMCYFGSSQYVLNEKHTDSYHDENYLLSKYPMLEHPNIKRGVIKRITANNISDFDGRIISEGDSIIELNHFQSFVAQFKYNINVSGFRLSIPNRFIDSFISGTAILTDELSVKWYQPFGCEVYETVAIGYKKTDDVDWNKYIKDLHLLSDNISVNDVHNNYEKYWSPYAFSSYIVNMVQ